MCCVDQFIDLTSSNECQITYCKVCKTFSLSYKSCCASFTEVELKQFRQILEGLRAGDFSYELAGSKKAIIKNLYACIGFCLAEEEVSLMVLQIKEALTLFEAFHIIYK